MFIDLICGAFLGAFFGCFLTNAYFVRRCHSCRARMYEEALKLVRKNYPDEIKKMIEKNEKDRGE
jgi:hypothetical protein